MVMSDSPAHLKEEGLRQFKSGHYDEALATFGAAATAFATIPDNIGQAEMLNNMGVIYQLKGQYDAAATALQQAQTSFAQAGDMNRQGQTLANLGELQRHRGDYHQAGRCYSDAAEKFAQTGDKDKQADMLWALSLLRTRQRHWLEAIYLMHDSLKMRPRRHLMQILLYTLLRLGVRLIGGKQ